MRAGSRPTWRSCQRPLLLTVCGWPTSFVSQWIWSQFTLADHTFVWLSNAPYLIFKFAVAHRQSFDDDIRAMRHIQLCRKQPCTNLEFVHDAHRTLSLYAPNKRKSTQKELTSPGHKPRLGFEDFPTQYIFPERRLVSRKFRMNLRSAMTCRFAWIAFGPFTVAKE